MLGWCQHLPQLPPWQLARTFLVAVLAIGLGSNILAHYVFRITWHRWSVWPPLTWTPFVPVSSSFFGREREGGGLLSSRAHSTKVVKRSIPRIPSVPARSVEWVYRASSKFFGLSLMTATLLSGWEGVRYVCGLITYRYVIFYRLQREFMDQQGAFEANRESEGVPITHFTNLTLFCDEWSIILR